MTRHVTAARFGACVTAFTIFATFMPSPARAAEDPAAKRREVQKQRAAAAAKVNVLKADDARLEEALDALNANVKGAESRASAARQAEAVANQQAEAAKAAEVEARARLTRAEDELRSVAVRSYVGGAASEAAAPARGDLNATARHRALLDVIADTTSSKIDALRAAKEDVTARREAAVAAQERAARRANEVRGALSAAKRARDDQLRIAVAVEGRLERALAEAESLAAIDRQLAAEIQKRQAALARKVPPTSGRASRGASGRAGSVNTRTVRGIVVAEEIADNLEALLAAADQDGMSFGGSGYRSSEQQAATRRANCGTSDYDVYDKPASQCSPPTARPGQSMHERGLAVDFTYNGRLISGRSNPGFQWLSRNASRFGFYNLPSEPWHWSTNGN